MLKRLHSFVNDEVVGSSPTVQPKIFYAGRSSEVEREKYVFSILSPIRFFTTIVG